MPQALNTSRALRLNSKILTAPSKWLAQQTEEHFGVPASRTNHSELHRPRTLQPPTAQDAQGAQATQAASPLRKWAANGEVVLAHASNFRPVKRVEDVVRAFAVVRCLSSRLSLAYDGPDLPKAAGTLASVN